LILKPIDVTDIAARDGLVLCLRRAPWAPSNIKWLGPSKKFENGTTSPASCQRLPHGIFISMNMKNPIYDSNHWRQRAEHAQAKADQISWDAGLKRKLLRTAEEYDRLAQRAEQWRSTEKA
jgi:hypothetical protein